MDRRTDMEVPNKISQITQLIEQKYKEKRKGKALPGYVVGVFTTLKLEDIAWLDTEMRRLSELIKEIKYVNVCNIKRKDQEKALSECTFYIYICSEHKWKNLLSPSDRKKALASFGKKKNLIVLIVDMMDSSDEEKSRIIKDQPHLKDYALGLFLFRRIEEKTENSQDVGAQGGISERRLTSGSLDQYKNLQFRLPQPAPAAEDVGLQTRMPQRRTDRKHVVGIFSRSAEQDYDWLVRLLKEAFQDFVGDVKYCYISNNGYQNLRDDLSQCTFGILYHTKNRGRVNLTDVNESLYDEELETLSVELGRRNVIVLVDDLEDGTDEEKTQILQSQPKIRNLACELILISASEKANKLRLATKLKSLKYIFEGEYYAQQLQDSGNPDPYAHPPIPQLERRYTANGAGNASPVQTRERMPIVATTSSKSTVAIFSRSEESDYFWLSQQLSSGGLDVRSYKISSFHKDHPQETPFQCKLVILYHNMYNGKLRLTDAKDAMYHEELEMLSTKFGKRRVIVVIDDLVESSDKIKAQILDRQPSTGRFARDIFLFSVEEKKHLNRLDSSKDGRRMMEKVNKIKEMLSK